LTDVEVIHGIALYRNCRAKSRYFQVRINLSLGYLPWKQLNSPMVEIDLSLFVEFILQINLFGPENTGPKYKTKKKTNFNKIDVQHSPPRGFFLLSVTFKF